MKKEEKKFNSIGRDQLRHLGREQISHVNGVKPAYACRERIQYAIWNDEIRGVTARDNIIIVGDPIQYTEGFVLRCLIDLLRQCQTRFENGGNLLILPHVDWNRFPADYYQQPAKY